MVTLLQQATVSETAMGYIGSPDLHFMDDEICCYENFLLVQDTEEYMC